MTRPPESAAGSEIRSLHMVQLFDDLASRAEFVSAFVRDGLADGDTCIVVAAAEHWDSIASRLHAEGVSVEHAVAGGRLVVREAWELLGQLTFQDRPDPELFGRTVGTLLREASARGRPIRVYGEMVDLLAGQGEYRGAQRLEELWNTLNEQVPFTLLCGYSSIHFGHPRSADALRGICRVHSHVVTDARDLLGTFLLDRHQAVAGTQAH